MNLLNLDLIFIFAYFLILILIGYFSSRKVTTEDYLIGERKLGPWTTMATLNASKTGSILMIFVALVYLWGFSALWYFVGMVLGVLLFLPFALKLKENSKTRFYTLADYFRHNYGKKLAMIVSLVTIFLMGGYLILNLIAGAKIFVFFTEWPFWISATVMMSVVLTYLLLGGFKAVVKTDILQYAAIIFILSMLALIVFKGSIIPVSEWNIFQADFSTIIGFFIVGTLFPFAMPDMWQRVYAAKDKAALKKGLILSAIIYAVFAFLLGLIALTVKAMFPEIDPDLALIYGFKNLLPAGILGLSVVLLFAAIMSSIDTYIFTGASAIVQDFFIQDKEKTVKTIKKVILILVVIGTIISILVQNLIIGAYIFIAPLVALAMTVLATWIKKDVNHRTLLFGLSFGIIGYFFFLIMSLLQGVVNPIIVIISLGTTILGLVVGGIVSWFKK